MISRHSAAHAAGSQPDLDVSAEVFTYVHGAFQELREVMI